MSHFRQISVAIAAWIAIVLLALIARLTFAAPTFSFNESLVWLFVGIAPAATLFSLMRGAPSTSIAQVLYDAEHPADVANRDRR